MPSNEPVRATPRWVKAFGVVALILVLLIAAVLLFGGGNHGPGRHLGSDAPPSSQQHLPPAGTHP